MAINTTFNYHRKDITMEHSLKIAPVHFAPVADGLKHAELRINDRDYRCGDKITLNEYQGGFTGESVEVVITHVADVGAIVPGYVLLSIDLMAKAKAKGQQ